LCDRGRAQSARATRATYAESLRKSACQRAYTCQRGHSPTPCVGAVTQSLVLVCARSATSSSPLAACREEDDTTVTYSNWKEAPAGSRRRNGGGRICCAPLPRCLIGGGKAAAAGKFRRLYQHLGDAIVGATITYRGVDRATLHDVLVRFLRAVRVSAVARFRQNRKSRHRPCSTL